MVWSSLPDGSNIFVNKRFMGSTRVECFRAQAYEFARRTACVHSDIRPNFRVCLRSFLLAGSNEFGLPLGLLTRSGPFHVDGQ